jgi:hypothetical protein
MGLINNQARFSTYVEGPEQRYGKSLAIVAHQLGSGCDAQSVRRQKSWHVLVTIDGSSPFWGIAARLEHTVDTFAVLRENAPLRVSSKGTYALVVFRCIKGIAWTDLGAAAVKCNL